MGTKWKLVLTLKSFIMKKMFKSPATFVVGWFAIVTVAAVALCSCSTTHVACDAYSAEFFHPQKVDSMSK